MAQQGKPLLAMPASHIRVPVWVPGDPLLIQFLLMHLRKYKIAQILGSLLLLWETRMAQPWPRRSLEGEQLIRRSLSPPHFAFQINKSQGMPVLLPQLCCHTALPVHHATEFRTLGIRFPTHGIWRMYQTKAGIKVACNRLHHCVYNFGKWTCIASVSRKMICQKTFTE